MYLSFLTFLLSFELYCSSFYNLLIFIILTHSYTPIILFLPLYLTTILTNRIKQNSIWNMNILLEFEYSIFITSNIYIYIYYYYLYYNLYTIISILFYLYYSIYLSYLYYPILYHPIIYLLLQYYILFHFNHTYYIIILYI